MQKKQQRITRSFSYRSEPSLAYLALTEQRHFERWWAADAQTEDFVGGELKLARVPHGCRMKVRRLESDRVIEWACVSPTAAWAGLDECVGTRVRFTISRGTDGGTQLQITHTGWSCRNRCFETWGRFWSCLAGQSLKSYLETGEGQPLS
jgi:uncharacterized protein YndB with AHSA1/START domain